jgi:hypothetical protein
LGRYPEALEELPELEIEHVLIHGYLPGLADAVHLECGISVALGLH